MTDWAASAREIDAAFAEPIAYTGAALTNAPLTAIYNNVPASEFMGPGATARRVWFEIRYDKLPMRPAKGHRIAHATGDWAVIDITDRDDIAAWELTVERA
ncbi:MAG: hypothetical protein U5M50_03970 [Sphingobium sp.]|nr:hypothetical protein [Sphingobium sp.]